MQNNKNTFSVLYSTVYGGCCTVKSPRPPLLIVRPTFCARAKRRATGNFIRTVLYQVPSPVYIVRALIHSAATKKNFFEKLFQKTFLRRHGDRPYDLYTLGDILSIHHSKKSDVYCSVLLLFCFCSICYLLFCIVPFSVCFLQKNEIVDFCIFTISVFEKHLKAVCKIQKRHAGDTKTFSKNFFVSPRSV